MFTLVLKNRHFRGFYCFLRYLYFTRIKKNYNILEIGKTLDEKFVNQKDIDFSSFKQFSQDKYLDTVLRYEARNQIIKKNFKKTIRNFNGERIFRLTSNLHFSKKDYKNLKVLSVGPRNEGEIFSLITLGVNKKNIKAVDLHSYSPLINTGAIETIDFSDIKFDLITVGWVLIYCKDLKLVLKNLVKLSSINTIISFGSTIKSVIDERVANKNIINILNNDINIKFDVIYDNRINLKSELLVIKIKSK